MAQLTGDDFQKTWQLCSSEPDVFPIVPIDLTGCGISFGLVPISTLTEPALTCALGDETGYLTVAEPTTGTIVLDVPGVITANFTPGRYICAVKILWSNGNKQTVNSEQVTFIQGIAP